MSISILSFSHEHEYFIFFHAYFKHISACFSSTKPDFDDTSPWFMILRWYFSLHFLEKSHFAKVLNINDIILYLSRKMIHWDFFSRKPFLRARVGLSFVLQFSAERNNFFIKNSWNSCVFQTKLVYLHQLMKKRLHCQAEVSVNIDVDCECITKLLKYKTWNHEENL